MISRIMCLLNRHTVNRNRVKWDGLNYLGSCSHCGKSVTRMRKHVWKADPVQQIEHRKE